MVEFPISGVETYWWLPPLVAFAVSALAATGGLSGAFLLLPFQVSVLGFTGPGASPTNLFFNVIGIPSGVYRYCRERRMVWALSWAIIIGSLPGMLLGAMIRVKLMPDPEVFKGFAALVLAFVAVRLLQDVLKSRHEGKSKNGIAGQNSFIADGHLCPRAVTYRFQGERYSVSTIKLGLLSFVVGIAGGAYGIGGGAVIAPFLVSFFGLPVYTVAGAALFGTFASSLFGIAVYWLIDVLGIAPGVSASPDWLLGLTLGVGGAAGMYLGARLQQYLPARLIKAILTAFLLFVATRYIIEAYS